MSKSEVNREEWIANVCASFVTSGQANRNYYKLILETLWPPGQTLPGPVVFLSEIRQVIDRFRDSSEPYKDVSRRIRELQGEEGIIGIEKQGNGVYTRYQLVSLEINPKRIQRIKLGGILWKEILNKYSHCCAVCGRGEPLVRLDQDHKIPRLRGGGNQEENWQPLCKECNNFKSTACRGCQLECQTCPWAFPEQFAPIKMQGSDIKRIKDAALKKRVVPEELLQEIIKSYFERPPS
ncbi:HNH endonuclease [Oscillatoria acuminata]|uniref:Restriction endonuclease n=1 Tax=Oscillatoria acuminata PCC 6304 TaxID=56110 RepID=K9TMK4_9CYAN|nr:HNH endonuclease signature motif containing protein [Oscillatoria acuminata]AFY84097.1 restriction endonuclease [Oscillatoria acuminata PCC 6304]